MPDHANMDHELEACGECHTCLSLNALTADLAVRVEAIAGMVARLDQFTTQIQTALASIPPSMFNMLPGLSAVRFDAPARTVDDPAGNSAGN